MARSSSQRTKSQRRRAQRRQAKQRARSMQSWRKPHFESSLLCPVMKQAKSTFYAVAYVRQLEYHLKLHNQMPKDEHLAIQDFINQIPRDCLDDDLQLIVDASLVLPILVEKDMLLERDCPLTESLDRTVSQNTSNCPRFFAKKITLHNLYPAGSSTYSPKRYDAFHEKLIQMLKLGVVAVGLNVYPSYSKLKHKEIYYPTKKELAGKTEVYGRVMICTGHNYDKLRRLFYEFQESAGLKVCDVGFVRVYADVVYQFTEMEVEREVYE